MRFFVCFIMCFCGASCFAQQNYTLVVNLVNADQSLLNSIAFERKLNDSLSIYKEAEHITSQLQFKGFLLAEITTLSFKEKNVYLTVTPNQRFQLVSLAGGNLPKELVQAIGFKEGSYRQVNFDVSRLERLFKSVLSYYENNGYPFANVSLDSVLLGQSTISAIIKAQPYQRFVYDSIQVVGSAQISQQYLQSYLNIKRGAVYVENTITQVRNKLRELQFLQVVKDTEVSFSADKAVVSVFVNKKNANQFDGILGLQQNTATGKSQLIGNLKLHLKNALKLGEQLDFSYQGVAERSQLLDIKVNIPHILRTSFGLSPSLYLYKQDSSFVNVDAKLGFDYLIKGNNSIQFFVENKSTSLVGLDAYQNVSVLPSILDVNTTFYGLGLNLEDLDYRFNPQKGYSIVFNIAVGAKKITRNAAIPQNLYVGVRLSSTSYRLFNQINCYKTIAKNTVLALSNQTALLQGKYLLENEVFRLGGQKSLRGFNELSILATSYTYGNVELRYLLAQNSFLFAFYNQAYIQYKTPLVNFSDYPLGFGTGVNVETSLGILSVSYALGKQKNNPLNLRQGKIHFGITALF